MSNFATVFELQRRVVLFNPNTTLADTTQLGYDGDPNDVINGNTPGETLIYNSPMGTRYQESDGTQWFKGSMPNTWYKFLTTATTGDTETFYEEVTAADPKFILDDTDLFGVADTVDGETKQISWGDFKTNIEFFMEAVSGDTVWLPSGATEGDIVNVTDVSGAAFTNNIIINSENDTHGVGRPTEEQAIIDSDYGSIRFRLNSEGWWSVVAFVN